MSTRRSSAGGSVVSSLARVLSKLGVASRSEALALIAAGRVRVDGRVELNPTRRIAVDRSRLSVDAAPVAAKPRRLIAFHKPRGVVTTRRDPEGRRTVFDVLGDAADGLVAVGRLDLASTGLLLLTTDTALSHRLTDPSRHVLRRYVVTVRGRVTDVEAARLTSGLDTAGERGRVDHLRAGSVRIRKASGRETHLIVELTEGRNREVRRLFAAVGHEVTRLHRVAFGPVELGDLAPGAWRDLEQILPSLL